MNVTDTEKYHTPELYAVWNLKFFLVQKVADANPYNSQFFFFTDAGAWREKVFAKWPDYNFVKQVSLTIGDLPLFGQIDFVVNNFPW